jgi:hypothetical protein
MADTPKYITSRLTTWPTRDTLHSQIPIYKAAPLKRTSQYNMADIAKYITSRLTTWPTRDTQHSQIPIYTAVPPLTHTSQYNMADTPKYKSTRRHGLSHKFHLSTHFLTAFFTADWIKLATNIEWIQLATIFSTITSSPGH